MKKKINRILILITVPAILLTAVLITYLYYGLFKAQILDELKSYSYVAGDCTDLQALRELGEELEPAGVRITLIDGDGTVRIDNMADSAQMENHSDRPEVQEALEDGEGSDVRESETLSVSTYYYAVRLADGRLLRTAKDAGSLYSVLLRALPMLCVILVVLLALCFMVAHYTTGRLVRPIERLAANLDGETETSGYPELEPLLNTIRSQHADILKSAQVRQEFTANVSHELKTPLTSISGYAELIETGMASEEDTVRFAHGIRSNANRLLTLINDTIRLSELDDGDQRMDTERLNLYEMAANCVEMLRMSAEKHDVTITLNGYECYITGNRQMIDELLYNLCDNAIRYNNAGGSVTVEVYVRREGAVLSVKDTGIGIPPEHQERIFERFYRVDKSRSKSTGGTGLGLAIVKHIIVRHHARMELHSEVGKGTEITVQFPHGTGL